MTLDLEPFFNPLVTKHTAQFSKTEVPFGEQVCETKKKSCIEIPENASVVVKVLRTADVEKAANVEMPASVQDVKLSANALVIVTVVRAALDPARANVTLDVHANETRNCVHWKNIGTSIYHH
ncbi:hypothetical protein CHS0354_022429 [Potamilus streckersoni]|uniref:Uncharacterized protein n=1 Tax=Potamilus streckersoni TaxID=2493646 RepID=A0AAE0SX71_9BIVA|nr:hypothetical protein CHS0354_022429 [Potamilus streckersoni]